MLRENCIGLLICTLHKPFHKACSNRPSHHTPLTPPLSHHPSHITLQHTHTNTHTPQPFHTTLFASLFSTHTNLSHHPSHITLQHTHQGGGGAYAALMASGHQQHLPSVFTSTAMESMHPQQSIAATLQQQQLQGWQQGEQQQQQQQRFKIGRAHV